MNQCDASTEISEAIDMLDVARTFQFEDDTTQEKWDKAILVAMSAMRRMLPKPPLTEKNHPGLGYVFTCPHCRRMVDGIAIHCKFCGQKIDLAVFDRL